MIQNKWVVHKFGGTSLADADCFRKVAQILVARDAPAESAGQHQAVIVSAMSGMTDSLLNLVSEAEKAASRIDEGLQSIATRYAQTAAQLLRPQDARNGGNQKVDDNAFRQVIRSFEADTTDASNVLHALSLIRSASDRARDLIAGLGELWSARLLAAYLQRVVAERDQEPRPVGWIDTRQLIVASPGEMGPAVDWESTRANATTLLSENPPDIVVMTGFIASDSTGLQTTLGRNGSDFSASIVGSVLGAASITIWTDVDGVMSADPRRVPEAEVIQEISYNEAMELAYFGASVIHPQTMSPAIEKGIPVWIRNTFNPKARGTRIGPGDGGRCSVKGITSIDKIALVSLEGAGMIGVPGTASRLFEALRDARISVILISQASSEHSICFAVPTCHESRVEAVVRRAFSEELERGLIHDVDVQPDYSVVAVVGDGMAGTPGIAARFFSTLGNAGINVKGIAQGSSERNISAVVERQDVTRALRAVHSGFTLSSTTLSIGIVGPGSVGSVLLEQLAGQIERLRSEFNLDLQVRALATSSKMLLNDRALDLSNWRQSMEQDGQALEWNHLEEHVNSDHLPHAVLIDCSASEHVAMLYEHWLSAGIHIVTPNKKAGSGPLENYQRIKTACRKHLTHFLYETTVGAGLPIIETLRDLKQTGDEILSLEGILSGTLAYLFNVFDTSRPFSAIVREARACGFTEPDPRDDLSGLDVARKLVILGREMGLTLELEDVEVESLIPKGLEGGAVDSFLTALEEYDHAIAERWQQAHQEGRVLRFVGRLTRGGRAIVKLETLPADHPFASLNLTDNIVRFETQRYRTSPLVVQGPGAGRDVTAGGVFADLLRLAAYLGAAR